MTIPSLPPAPAAASSRGRAGGTATTTGRDAGADAGRPSFRDLVERTLRDNRDGRPAKGRDEVRRDRQAVTTETDRPGRTADSLDAQDATGPDPGRAADGATPACAATGAAVVNPVATAPAGPVSDPAAAPAGSTGSGVAGSVTPATSVVASPSGATAAVPTGATSGLATADGATTVVGAPGVASGAPGRPTPGGSPAADTGSGSARDTRLAAAGAADPAMPTVESTSSAAPQPSPKAVAAAASTASVSDVTVSASSDAVPDGLAPVSGSAVSGPSASAPAASAGQAPSAAPAQQVVPAVTRLVARGDGTHSMTLRLHPVDLGEVRVTVTVKDAVVDVTLAAGAAARDALRSGSPALRSLLDLAGASTGSIVIRDLPGASSQAAAAGHHTTWSAAAGGHGQQGGSPSQQSPGGQGGGLNAGLDGGFGGGGHAGSGADTSGDPGAAGGRVQDAPGGVAAAGDAPQTRAARRTDSHRTSLDVRI